MEKTLLSAAIQDRKYYKKLERLLDPAEDLSDISVIIWEGIEEYYNNDKEAEKIDINLLGSRLGRKYPKQEEIIKRELSSLFETSPKNVIKELIELKQKSIATKIINTLLQNVNSKEVFTLVESLKKIKVDEEEEILPCSETAKDTLVKIFDEKSLIRIYPNSLNEKIGGGAFRGNTILVYARPNTGKSMFMINLTRGLIRDGNKVLYLINEEPKGQIIQRILSRIFTESRDIILNNIDAFMEKADEVGLNNLFVEDINPGTFHEIRGLIEAVNPDVLIVDQLRNIKVKSDNRVNQLEQAATELRNVAKQYNILCVATTQAGDSAENKLVLDMGDVDYSNTGIPAQMDLMIGIGINKEFRETGTRMISIAKNKLTSDHSHFPVKVEEEISRIISI